MKYPILPSAEDGASPNPTSTRTVLFVTRSFPSQPPMPPQTRV
ncbi:MAG TPA: hypothetical protein V6D12_03185 [Candidatus Obscuribacterales bacterium]